MISLLSSFSRRGLVAGALLLSSSRLLWSEDGPPSLADLAVRAMPEGGLASLEPEECVCTLELPANLVEKNLPHIPGDQLPEHLAIRYQEKLSAEQLAALPSELLSKIEPATIERLSEKQLKELTNLPFDLFKGLQPGTIRRLLLDANSFGGLDGYKMADLTVEQIVAIPRELYPSQPSVKEIIALSPEQIEAMCRREKCGGYGGGYRPDVSSFRGLFLTPVECDKIARATEEEGRPLNARLVELPKGAIDSRMPRWGEGGWKRYTEVKLPLGGYRDFRWNVVDDREVPGRYVKDRTLATPAGQSVRKSFG
jgi:hypothetical protein